jgi:hypothetical protein
VEDVSAETVLVEVCGVQGRVLARERVVLDAGRRAFTIGRSVNADVTIDDDYAAPVHASIEVTPEGRILVSDLGSRNGVVVADKRHQGVSGLELADGMFKIGHTRLRVRTARESLAPEKPDQIEAASLLRNPALVAAAAALICAAQLAYSKWLEAPRDLAAEIVKDLIFAGLLGGAWIMFWALLSRITQWVWRWSVHAAILLCVVAAAFAVEGILEFAAFLVGLPQSASRAAGVGLIAVAWALYLHLTQATSMSARSAVLTAVLVPALLGGTVLWIVQRELARDVDYIGAKLRIYPPELRLRSSAPVEAFFQGDAAGLRGRADQKRAELPAFDGTPDSKLDEQ